MLFLCSERQYAQRQTASVDQLKREGDVLWASTQLQKCSLGSIWALTPRELLLVGSYWRCFWCPMSHPWPSMGFQHQLWWTLPWAQTHLAQRPGQAWACSVFCLEASEDLEPALLSQVQPARSIGPGYKLQPIRGESLLKNVPACCLLDGLLGTSGAASLSNLEASNSIAHNTLTLAFLPSLSYCLCSLTLASWGYLPNKLPSSKALFGFYS